MVYTVDTANDSSMTPTTNTSMDTSTYIKVLEAEVIVLRHQVDVLILERDGARQALGNAIDQNAWSADTLHRIKLLSMNNQTVMPAVNTTMGPFDHDRYTRLREALEENLKTPMTQFSFEGHIWDRAFTKYMLEYLSPLLGFGEYKQPKDGH